MIHFCTNFLYFDLVKTFIYLCVCGGDCGGVSVCVNVCVFAHARVHAHKTE